MEIWNTDTSGLLTSQKRRHWLALQRPRHVEMKGHRGQEERHTEAEYTAEASLPSQPSERLWPLPSSRPPLSPGRGPSPSSSQTRQRVQSVLEWFSLFKKVPGGQRRQVGSPQGSTQGAFM